jgi:hypothetical protein
MNQEWRNELFRPNEESDPNSLGFPLSKAKGIRILKVSYRTWKRWEELAMTIPEYKLQHIQLNKRAEVAGAIAPIVPYQVWVVGKIGEIYSKLPDGLPKKWMAQEYLSSKKDEFTREVYQQEQSRHISLFLNS